MNFTHPTILLSLLLSLCLGGCAAQGTQPANQGAESAATRLQTAEAMFRERCKAAGEKITRTVDNVEGIFLMKIRPDKINFDDQFALTDPYGDDLGGDGYIQSFTKGQYQATHTGTPAPGSPPRIGYRYVEALDPQDGKRYRYTGSTKAVGKKDETAPNVQLELKRNPNYDLNIYAYVLDKTPAPGPQPRYGVTYDDISTKEERDYWIAGSSLKVIDLKTNEVIAERIGYMMDRGQGSTSGGRAPWLLATENSCPNFREGFKIQAPASAGQSYQTLDFVEKVLKPKQGN